MEFHSFAAVEIRQCDTDLVEFVRPARHLHRASTASWDTAHTHPMKHRYRNPARESAATAEHIPEDLREIRPPTTTGNFALTWNLPRLIINRPLLGIR
jgi:hypothetical protein